MSSRWSIDVYDGTYEEPPGMNGWLLDQPEIKRVPHMNFRATHKPKTVPVIYAEEVCHGGGGSQQCRFLQKKLVGGQHTYTCFKNTTQQVKINRSVQNIRDGWLYAGANHPSRNSPVGDNCEGIQMLHGSVVERYEGSRSVPELPGLTIFAFENMIIECLSKAYEHLEATIHQQELRGKRHSCAEVLGMFCTSVRSELGGRNDRMAGEQTRPITNCMTRPDNWSSILVPKACSYGYSNQKINFADGGWVLNYDKLTELARAAQTGYRFVSDEATVQSECTASLLLVERSIPTLNALADQARLINIESDRVIANMMSIAESLER